MSDISSSSSEDLDPLPVNQRSSAFIDGVAFLEFVRLKSLATLKEGSAENNVAPPVPASEAAPLYSNKDTTTNLQTSSEIRIEDWDSLFDAVEERLRDTVEQSDSIATPAAAQSSASRVKAVVLDCVAALGQLHNALRQERSAHAAHPFHTPASDKTVASPLTNGHDLKLNN
jgi:hypothetical protein